MASPSKILKQPVKLALIQLASGADKSRNLSRARDKVLLAARRGARIVVLPECFNSPYGVKYFSKYAEPLSPPAPPSSSTPQTTSQPTEQDDNGGSPSYHALSAMARDANCYLIGGSIPERHGHGTSEKLYNTSLTFAPDGSLLASHRKIHLFDISIPNKITFRESDALSPGDALTMVDIPEYGKIAVAICYDVRFPELATIAARRGAFLLVYPGAFNLTTGALHWELQARARAVDNQVYVGMCSPARDMDADYHAWGHSMVVDPNAEVVAEAGTGEEMVEVELSGERIEEVRRNIPITMQRRFDVYPDISQCEVKK